MRKSNDSTVDNRSRIDGARAAGVQHVVTIRFGGYQGPASVHTRAVEVFQAALERRLGDDAALELEAELVPEAAPKCRREDLDRAGVHRGGPLIAAEPDRHHERCPPARACGF